jgi:alginate O-acetyltransferase complex protein AlgI
MTFVSFEYLVLLLTTCGLYYVLPWRGRILLLLVASYVFYSYWEPWYALVIASTTLVDFTAALLIDRTESLRRRRALLATSIAFNLGMLFYFKYTNFALDTLRPLVSPLGMQMPTLEILLPAGISFYTFQEMSYTIDVYRRRIRPTRDLALFATFVSFFPQLVAGPIERAETLMPQLAVRQRFDPGRVVSGLGLILVGLAKKLVLADRLAYFAAPKFLHPGAYDSWELLLCLAVMPISLYLDFGGYTDIARGSGRLLGIELQRNFLFPFASANPLEIWRRWHITLVNWIRDYVFVLLPGSPGLSFIVPLVLVGLWHGADWKFALWGLGQGVAAAAYVYWRIEAPAVLRPRRWGVLATAGWLLLVAYNMLLIPLFFSPDLTGAVAYWKRLFTGGWSSFGEPSLNAALAFVLGHQVVQIVGRNWDWRGFWGSLPAPARGLAAAVLFYVVLFGAVPLAQRFVYFQF